MKFYADTHLVSQVNLQQFKDDALNGLDDNSQDIDQATAASNLSDNYNAAAQATPGLDTEVNPGGETLLQRVKDAVCDALKDIDGNDSDVFDAIMSALESVMPGGVLIKWFIKGVVHFLLKLGEDEICGIPPAASTTTAGN